MPAAVDAWRAVMRVDEAKRHWPGNGHGVGVALLDSGCRPDHVQLVGRLGSGLDLLGASGDVSHGTHLAALIAGSDTGVACDARVIPVRLLDALARGDKSLVIRLRQALRWLLAKREELKLGVICISFCKLSNSRPGIESYDPECEALIGELRQRGVVTVAPAGNYYAKYKAPGLAWPAVLPQVVAVGASVAIHEPSWKDVVWDGGRMHRVRAYGLQVDQLAPFSQRCPDTGQVFAPGISISSADAASADGLTSRWGTSQACALVSGVLAWLQSVAIRETGARPDPAVLLAALRRGGVRIDDAASAHDDNVPHTEATYTRVDAVGAVRALANGTMREIATPNRTTV